MGIYFIYNLIQCIHTKIFGIRQDKLWSIALCYISANAVAYMYIYFLSIKQKTEKKRATAIGYWERASGYVLSAYRAPQHYIEGSHDHIQVGVHWRL